MEQNTNSLGASCPPLGAEGLGQNMFYQATPIIFQRAKELRNQTTESENLLWNYLCNNKLGLKFRRQHPASQYILDFYAHSIKLAIELDGSIHCLEEVKKNDGIRQEYLESLGIHFMRFDNKEIFINANEVVDKIRLEVERLTTLTPLRP